MWIILWEHFFLPRAIGRRRCVIRASRPGCVVGGGGHSRLGTGASIDRIGGRQRPPVTINWHARERGKSHGYSTGTREWRARFTPGPSWSLVDVRTGSLKHEIRPLWINTDEGQCRTRYIHRNFWAFYEKLTLLRERKDECLLNVEKIILHEKIHLFAIKIEILGELFD